MHGCKYVICQYSICPNVFCTILPNITLAIANICMITHFCRLLCTYILYFLKTIIRYGSILSYSQSNPPSLDGCISTNVPVKNLEGFFLRHLEKDLIALSSLLDRSIDDAVLAVHLILKWISQLSDENFPGIYIIFKSFHSIQ